jgi:capsular exopolysaccharide synthesis family protein
MQPPTSNDRPQPGNNAPQAHGGYGYGGNGQYGYGAGGYGQYGYGQYGYGYGYGSGAGVQRSIMDYLMILRERIWYVVFAFLVVFASVAVFTFSRVPLYKAVASVQIFRRDPVAAQVQGQSGGVTTEVTSAEDLNTQVKILESTSIAQRVADSLNDEDLHKFLAPYQRAGAPPPSAAAIIYKNRAILPQRLSLVIVVEYTHPDKVMAAKIADLLVNEYIAYNQGLRTDEAMKAVEDLKVQADEQEIKVKDLANSLLAYRQKNNMVSLDARKDIVTDKLKTLSNYVTEASAKLQDAEVRWKQVLERKNSPDALLGLGFIAAQPLINPLQQQVATQKIAIAELSQHYREKHPKMIEARRSLLETQAQLQRALDAAAAQIEADYQTAKRDYDSAHDALDAQERQSLDLDSYGVAYSNLERDYHINEQLLEGILGRMRESSVTSDVETESAHVVDHATPPNTLFFPNIPFNLGLGAIGGLGIGIAFALFVAVLDDRVKSAFDVESIVGIPVIGIIPLIKDKLEIQERANIAVTNVEVHAAEAFRTLHAALRLKDESKNAKCIAATSTVPGEGKSFISTNLALTFAANGERVLLLDCDLRRPNIHKLLKQENLKGAIDVLTGTATIDDVIIKDVFPNLDVIPSGGRSKSPSHLLNSKAFAVMISDLRKRYDRIIVDTPPLAPVSDALIVLPLLDGSLFTIFFNRVRRKHAQYNVQRLKEANVPCFGAILNGLNLNLAHYYYKQYYDKSYKDYYVKAKHDEEAR